MPLGTLPWADPHSNIACLSGEVQGSLGYAAMYDSLKDKDISKTLYDAWKRPSECVIALNDKIPDLVSQQDLKQYFKMNLLYVHVELPDRAKTVLEELGSPTFGEVEFISFLENEKLIK